MRDSRLLRALNVAIALAASFVAGLALGTAVWLAAPSYEPDTPAMTPDGQLAPAPGWEPAVPAVCVDSERTTT